ncbi:hypothetical protein MRX96_004547 [Rhipicephalus microplus]
MTAPGPSFMDTSPPGNFQPILDWSLGRMAIAVAGASIDETPDGIAGWEVTTQRGKKTSGSAETPLQFSTPTPGKRAAQPTRAQIIKRVNANFAKTARMPFVPRGEYKIVVRPHGRLIVGKVITPELVRAVASTAKKVDNVASTMTKFEARVEARITTGFEEMKLFMVQLLKEELSSLGLGVCTFVRKDLTLIKLDRFLDCDTSLELCAVEVVIGRKKQEYVFLQKIAPTIEDLEEWTRSLVDAAEHASTKIETDDTASPMDSKLAHLIEAHQSLQRRSKRMRHSRTLRKRITHLGREIEKYSRQLCAQQ